jgi:hypothetical protein
MTYQEIESGLPAVKTSLNYRHTVYQSLIIAQAPQMEGHDPGKPKWRGIFRASYAPYLGKYPSTLFEISTISGTFSSIIGTQLHIRLILSALAPPL